MRIGVVGAGAWGTALARIAALRGLETWLWVREPQRAADIADARENVKYLPGVLLPRTLRVTSELDQCVAGSAVVIHAVPSKATREISKKYGPLLGDDVVLVSATKGLEYGTNKTMSQILKETTHHAAAALSGPNHAEEVGRDQPTGTIVGHPRYPFAQKVVAALATPTFKLYPHTDRTGVELCGAYKNVVAIATGMSAGLGYGDNTQAALITLGLHEMSRMLPVLGGERRTAYGLAGVGDLVATCGSRHSRNRFFGEHLGQGMGLKEVVDALGGKVVEGVPAAKAFHEAAKQAKLDLGLTRAVYSVTEEEVPVAEAVRTLVALV